MSLQTIINSSSGLTVNRRKVVGIQYTRNQIPRISETPTLNPWQFEVELPTSLRYGEARQLLESIDFLDRKTPEIISFGNLESINWIFKYQGAASLSQLNNITVSSFTTNQLVLTNLPVINGSSYLFRANDLIQIGDNPYPFTSVYDVPRGTGSTVTITTHRPNILTGSVNGSHITVGANCEFNLFCPNMPIYKLIPGGSMRYTDGTLISNALIEWSGSFNLYEYLADA